ncbi:hypothetical protein K458DRAFT_414064 [Lentithecium fluviatile CBS 122367]|uniref:Uncharacterized protein n=1 Tax=Lentithecium fluviatile CBS 122367 TaxID=1168545 RepID=A0A6G1JDP2_9PLEO|nr:hypothetical protein K458DRAFT_414064 [Lentithecium fluviatile CBS 122367]
MFQQCTFGAIPQGRMVHAVDETQTVGFLFSLEDAAGISFSSYPEGLGRFDTAVRRLGGIGKGPDLLAAFSMIDNDAHFHYGSCEWASSIPPGTPGACGWCRVGGWTKGDLGCEKKHLVVGENFRLADMDCSFQC